MSVTQTVTEITLLPMGRKDESEPLGIFQMRASLAGDASGGTAEVLFQIALSTYLFQLCDLGWFGTHTAGVPTFYFSIPPDFGGAPLLKYYTAIATNYQQFAEKLPPSIRMPFRYQLGKGTPTFRLAWGNENTKLYTAWLWGFYWDKDALLAGIKKPAWL